MKKITSFEIDHTKLGRGLYTSRIDDEITTYDIRMVRPNTPPFLENAAIHTIEHIFATYVREKYPKNVIYFGPMGCRTGFYFITREISNADVIELVKSAMKFIADFKGEVPGASAEECGNYREHDLLKAKLYAKEYLEVLKGWSEQKLSYDCK